MAVKFFGQFLVERGVVSREKLLEAVELQESRNLKLGEMALDMGYVTPADIQRAHNAQLSKDMRLGDLLVSMGILTNAQLHDVITHQKNSHLYIGEALVLVNALSSAQLQQQLEAFKEDQAEYITNGIELPDGLPNVPILEMMADLTFKMITRVLHLQYRIGKCECVSNVKPNHMFAAMPINGDVEAAYILSVSTGLQKTIARAILHEEDVESEPAEVLEDTVMEFINIVCGNVAAKASQIGKILNIEPPQTLEEPQKGLEIPAGYQAISFPIHIGEGEQMELVIKIKA